MTDRAGLERLWAGWRMSYIDDEAARVSPTRGRSLFEGIEQSGLPDEQCYIVWRGRHVFALLNSFPYSSGHVMVLPKHAAASLGELDDATSHELWDGVRMAVAAVEEAYVPDGVNVGLNLGRAAGAGVPDHLHVHVVARWIADTNFMTTIAEARVLPESLDRTWHRLRDAWPSERG